MATVPSDVRGPSDAELIEAVRAGTTSAYGELYERHVTAAHNLARQLTRSPAEADDLVAEAFTKVLDTLRQGRGPDSAFRAYLLTALRHTAYDKTRRDRKVELSDDVSTVSGVSPEAVSVPFSDTAVAGLERSLAARAYEQLPERWQAVLWHTEVERQSPAEVALLLGLTPNGVSALAYRAREGLRQAYLQQHLAETPAQRCRATAERLGAWTRDGLSKRDRAQVEAHLDECERCRALAAELAEVNGALGVWVAPLVLGAGAAGYLAAAPATGVVAGSAGGAAGATAAVPRQMLGMAAAGVALAAAVATGLAAGSSPQVPAAAPGTTPPAATSQAPPAPTVPAPAQPPRASQPPAVQPSPRQQAPQPPVAPPVPAPTPEPGPPSLSATGPATPVSLVPGGGPADFPITVRNTGGSLSEPISSTLALPPGVSAMPSGPIRLAGDRPLRLDAPRAAAAQPPGTVYCPGGISTVTCATAGGLLPGDSVTLLFRLTAGVGSTGGKVTGSVTAGMAISAAISFPVTVTPPPLVDGVAVVADVASEGFWGWWPFHRRARLLVTATDTGTSSRPVTVTAAAAGELESSSVPVTCTSGPARISCTTKAAVQPHERVMLTFGVGREEQPEPGQPWPIAVTATLGTATASTTVTVPDWMWRPQLRPPDVPRPTVPVPPEKPTVPVPDVPTKPSPPTGPTVPAPPPTSAPPPPWVITKPISPPSVPARPTWATPPPNCDKAGRTGPIRRDLPCPDVTGDTK